jgi:hypothetical protein
MVKLIKIAAAISTALWALILLLGTITSGFSVPAWVTVAFAVSAAVYIVLDCFVT